MTLNLLFTVGLAFVGLIASWLKCVEPHADNDERSLIRRVRTEGWCVLFFVIVLTAANVIAANVQQRKLDARMDRVASLSELEAELDRMQDDLSLSVEDINLFSQRTNADFDGKLGGLRIDFDAHTSQLKKTLARCEHEVEAVIAAPNEIVAAFGNNESITTGERETLKKQIQAIADSVDVPLEQYSNAVKRIETRLRDEDIPTTLNNAVTPNLLLEMKRLHTDLSTHAQQAIGKRRAAINEARKIVKAAITREQRIS